MASINRKPHILKREKSLQIPRHVIFFDTETTPEKLPNGDLRQTLKLGQACYVRRAYGRNLEQKTWCSFDTIEAFWSFVLKYVERKSRLWIIAHNMSFDFTIVAGWKYLRAAGYKLKFFHNTGRSCIISVRGKAGSIMFVDSFNWFHESVASLGNRLGIPKLQINFETCTDSFLRTYCKRDVEILIAGYCDFVRFLEGNKICRLCPTIASTAMAAYLFGFYDHKIYIHNNSEAIDVERAAYRGGRVECFRLGRLTDGPFYCLDVNSLYPAVMYHGVFPRRLIRTRAKNSVDTIRAAVRDQSVIARVLVDSAEPAYAVKRDRTIFPVGRFWVTLTSPELVYALKRNHIRKVERACFYEQSSLFARYVKRFYGLRQDFRSAQVPSYVEICKLLLNSLYGKFGQRAEVWTKIGDAPDEPDRTEDVFYPNSNRRGRIRYLMGVVYELTGHEECFNSFPGISATVSAYARMYLYELMKIAGEENYFYCDTDSLIVNAAGLARLDHLIDPVKLGCLKIEEISNFVDLRGLKDYSTEAKTVIKGISKNAEKSADGSYTQDQWPSLVGLLRKTSADSYTIHKCRRVLNRKYTKGRVNRDKSISPFVLAEPDQPLLWPT